MRDVSTKINANSTAISTVPDAVIPSAQAVGADPAGAAAAAQAASEPVLGSPALSGYLLSSSNAGVRTWVPPPTSAVWGSITGMLSAQTDLQTALNAKVSTSVTINGHPLSANVTVTASDVGADPAGAAAAVTAASIGAPTGSGSSTGTNTGDETQATVLAKLATSTDGAVLAIKQGPTEANATAKLVIKDSTGLQKLSIAAYGNITMGTSTNTNPLVIDTNTTTSGLLVGSSAVLISGDQNYEKFEIRSSLQPTFTGRNSAGTVAAPLATTANKILFSLAGGGHDGVAWTATNPSLISMVAEELFSPTTRGSNIIYQTTQTGTATRTEKMRIMGNGNVGIGTSAPTSKLQVVGLPVYANNAAALAGGLTVGAFYRTGADPDPVCVVH